MYDLNCKHADFPLNFDSYALQVLRVRQKQAPEHQRLYRLLPAAQFLRIFASDRSRMSFLR